MRRQQVQQIGRGAPLRQRDEVGDERHGARHRSRVRGRKMMESVLSKGVGEDERKGEAVVIEEHGEDGRDDGIDS